MKQHRIRIPEVPVCYIVDVKAYFLTVYLFSIGALCDGVYRFYHQDLQTREGFCLSHRTRKKAGMEKKIAQTCLELRMRQARGIEDGSCKQIFLFPCGTCALLL